jgi:predicted glycosyltransferase
MLAICKYLRDSMEDVSILIVTGSPMLHSFRVGYGIDYIKLPCMKRSVGGELGVRFLEMNREDVMRLRSQLILASIRSFKPDIVLVDKKPLGLAGELEASLGYIKNSLPAAKVLLVLRDILDEPAATIEQWQNSGSDDAVQWFYDAVLVLGSAWIFDIRKEYRLSPQVSSKVVFCGYVRRERGAKARSALRRELSIADDEHLVLVTAGGGEDGCQLVRTYLSGLRMIPASRRVKSLIVTGPELDLVNWCNLAEMAATCPGVTLLEFTDDMMAHMEAADVVVSMAGYNTVCELVTLNKRAVVVPRVEPVAEQRVRAERMAGLGLFRTILPAQLEPAVLAKAVLDELSAARNGSDYPDVIDLDALPRIADILSTLHASVAGATAAAWTILTERI